MKLSTAVALSALVLFAGGCKKKKKGGADADGGAMAAMSSGDAGTMAAMAGADASTTAMNGDAGDPLAAADAGMAATATPSAPFVQKGIKPNKVVVGYMQDLKDENQCAVVTDSEKNKDKFAKDADKLASMMKAKVVTACPTTSVVGTCDVGLGMLDNYSGPKWTADTAKKDCLSKPRQKWLE